MAVVVVVMIREMEGEMKKATRFVVVVVMMIINNVIMICDS